MPKIVDREGRRRDLARAALRVIGRDGLDSASTRAVESGWSTGVLKHYFSDKDELLHEALREVERLNVERFDAARLQSTGLEAVRTAVRASLRATEDESRVWIAFMSRASVDGPSSDAMRRAVDTWVERWGELVVRGHRDGSIRPDLAARPTAIEIHALVNGLRVDMMFLSTRQSAVLRAKRADLVLLSTLPAAGALRPES